jgi:hypothetical protein
MENYIFGQSAYSNFQDACEHFIGWFDTGADTAGELRYQLEQSIKAGVVGDEPTHYEDALLALTDVELLNAFKYSRGEEGEDVQPINSIRPRLVAQVAKPDNQDYL